MTRQGFVNGSTLLGTAIAMVAFAELMDASGGRKIALLFAALFFLGSALFEYFGWAK